VNAAVSPEQAEKDGKLAAEAVVEEEEVEATELSTDHIQKIKNIFHEFDGELWCFCLAFSRACAC
jgi:hypothetical protein